MANQARPVGVHPSLPRGYFTVGRLSLDRNRIRLAEREALLEKRLVSWWKVPSVLVPLKGIT